jgi:hypothetical protein
MTPANQRLVAAGIYALVGALLGGLMALAAGIQGELGFTALAATAAALGGASLAPSMVARRPVVGVTSAMATYVLGVLLFPPFSILAGVGAPGLEGSLRPDENLIAIYFFAPVGLLVALPFLPAVIACGILGARLVQSRIPREDPPDREADIAANHRFRRRVALATLGLVSVSGLGFLILSSMASSAP